MTTTPFRRTAVAQDIPHYTTLDGAQAAIGAIEALLKGEHRLQSLQEYHAGVPAPHEADVLGRRG